MVSRQLIFKFLKCRKKLQIAIFAGKAKGLLFKPRLFLIKRTVIFGDLKVLNQAKENHSAKENHCAEYNFIFGIFVVVQIRLKPV